ncbi:inorganic phosphate transporter [Gilbertella persicaria]|uniref:inorganic phosphate transporter n=1 Tax=Gilbertella persicaria TaxID=101096 RepID=UPI00221ECF6A|nr:inorganic phosphate transporter [Gilbertella persicaria]KAI8091174.1 inorganic phosphate transporter [Gilbertella persicaria]
MPNWNRTLNHPLFNMGFFFVVRQVTKTFDLDNPEYLNSIRYTYLGSQIVIFMLSLYLLSIIRKKNDNTPLRYVEPGGKTWDGSESPEKLINTTVKDYDIQEAEKQMKNNFTSIAIIAFLHLKFGYVQPLIMQSVMGFKAFFLTKEAQIHLLNGKTTNGELRRPFRVEGPLSMISEKRQPKTDKGSIKRAEKAMKAQ